MIAEALHVKAVLTEVSKQRYASLARVGVLERVKAKIELYLERNIPFSVSYDAQSNILDVNETSPDDTISEEQP